MNWVGSRSRTGPFALWFSLAGAQLLTPAGCGFSQNDLIEAQEHCGQALGDSEQMATVVSEIEGEWGWGPDPETRCDEHPHTLTFDDTLSTMVLQYDEPRIMLGDSVRSHLEYRVLSIADVCVRMEVVDEVRTQPNGDTVVWDLVMLDANAYCWHRADLEIGSCTEVNERCSSL